MRVVKVIESKQWRNTVNGRTASIYGAHPASSDAERANWVIEARGYTWLTDHGTIGLCRQPVKTMAEALEVMERFNNRQ